MKNTLIFFCLTLIYILSGLSVANAAQSFSYSNVNLAINEHTGFISDISVTHSQANNTKEYELLVNGNLIHLDWHIKPSFINNKVLVSENGRNIINSYFSGDDFTVIRKIKRGTSVYSLLISYEITNTTIAPIKRDSILNPFLKFAYGFSSVIDEGGGYGSQVYGYLDFFMSNKQGAHVIQKKDIGDGIVWDTDEWIGWINRHHIAAIRIHTNASSETHKPQNLIMSAQEADTLTPKSILLSINQPDELLPEQIKPGESISIAFDVIVAPKLWNQLALINPSLDSVILKNLWDWFRSFCFFIWQLLILLHNLTGSWGVSIILFALVVRTILIPVTRLSIQYQEQAIKQQERIKPKLRDIKRDYKGIELSEKLVALYDKEHYDHLAPFKGMLGLFVQIPILIALFNLLGESPELKGQTFLWINDLSKSDRFFSLGIDLPFFGAYFNVLPFIMALITVISTFYAAKHSSIRTPVRRLFGMATLFFLLFYSFPSAMVLYWFSSTSFQLLQQIIEQRNN